MNRWLVVLAASILTAAGLAGALWLGAWAFDVRRFSTHERRLTRLLAHEPRQDQIEQAFRDEGTLLLGSADGEAALHALAGRFAGRKALEVESSGRRFPRTQAYRAGDMIYFIHFDDRRVMRAFAIVSR
jgi:hypothetical protein